MEVFQKSKGFSVTNVRQANKLRHCSRNTLSIRTPKCSNRMYSRDRYLPGLHPPKREICWPPSYPSNILNHYSIRNSGLLNDFRAHAPIDRYTGCAHTSIHRLPRSDTPIRRLLSSHRCTGTPVHRSVDTPRSCRDTGTPIAVLLWPGFSLEFVILFFEA